jgi:arsenate reductase
MEVWINPACSKCRAATTALDEAGVEYTVRRYLDDPPSRAELEEVLGRLGLEPWDITRSKEAAVHAPDLLTVPKDAEHRNRWLDALATHPQLIQRPILTADDGTTVVGRDPDSLASVLGR